MERRRLAVGKAAKPSMRQYGRHGYIGRWRVWDVVSCAERGSAAGVHVLSYCRYLTGDIPPNEVCGSVS